MYAKRFSESRIIFDLDWYYFRNKDLFEKNKIILVINCVCWMNPAINIHYSRAHTVAHTINRISNVLSTCYLKEFNFIQYHEYHQHIYTECSKKSTNPWYEIFKTPCRMMSSCHWIQFSSLYKTLHIITLIRWIIVTLFYRDYY